MPKIISANSPEGLEVVAAYRAGARYIPATETAEPEVLGSFTCAIDTDARLEVIAVVPMGGQGAVWLYDATPGDLAGAREVPLSRVAITSNEERQIRSRVFSLKAKRIYQIRASCIDDTPAGKFMQVQDAAGIDP